MKTPSDHLFKLIKTLTKSEKRAFRLNAISGKDAKKYVAIFDAIDAQTVYDEEAVKAKFKGESWLPRFSASKEYVYKALLNELSTYNQKHEPQYELTDFLIHIRVLQQKGFYKKCGELIKKAKKLATALNDHLKMLEILNLEGLNNPGGINPGHAKSIYNAQKNIFILLDNESEYDLLYKQSYELFSNSGYEGFDKASKNGFAILIKHPLLQDYNRALTYKSKRQFINIHYFNALGNRQDDEMHEWILKAIDLYRSNPKLAKQYSVNYATTLLNLHNSHLKRKSYDESLAVLEELRRFYPKTLLKQHERLTYIVEYASLHHEITTLVAFGDFKKALSLLPELDLYYTRHDQEISLPVMIKHLALKAQVYFAVREYRLCKALIDQILSEKNQTVRIDLQKQSRLLLLAVYFEQKKYDLLEYNLRTTQRQLQRISELNSLERQIFKILTRALNEGGNFDACTADFKVLRKFAVTNQYVPDYRDIIYWIESRCRNVSYEKVVIENR